MPDLYIMTLRALVQCEDEVEATLVADVIKTEGEKHLEPEDGDELYVAQVVKFGGPAEPAELIDRLLRSRNDLIKTRIKQCWDVAKQLDYVIFGLKKGLEPHLTGQYNHGDFIDVATAILERGEYPL